MVNAEELGVTQANVSEMLKSQNPEIRRLLGQEGKLGEALGLTNDWVAPGSSVTSVTTASHSTVISRLAYRGARTGYGPTGVCNTRRRSDDLGRVTPVRAPFAEVGLASP